MIILIENLKEHIENLQMRALSKMGQYFENNSEIELEDVKKLILVNKFFKSNTKLYMGQTVVHPVCNLTTFWLYRHQGYEYNDAIRMACFHHEKGWESIVYTTDDFTRFPRDQSDYDPWGKRRRFIRVDDLHGVIVHKVVLHKQCIIASLLFKDEFNAYLTRQCIIKRKCEDKWYVSHEDIAQFWYIEPYEVNQIYQF